MRRSRGFRLLSFGSMVLAGLVLAAGSLTFADRAAQAQTPEEDIAATVDALRTAWNEEDFDTFISYFTPAGLEAFFEIGPDDDAAAILAEERGFTGPITDITIIDLFVTSGNATATVQINFDAGFQVVEEWSFQFLDGQWTINDTEPSSVPLPEGVPVVDLFMQEYAFLYNEAAIQAADGNVAFRAFNIGAEDHEAILVRNETGRTILEVLEASDPEAVGPPPGIIDIAAGGPVGPGAEVNVVPEEPLAPGSYAFLCFVSAPDGTPHAFLGMVSEFSVSGGGPVDDDDDDDDGVAPIRPPSTGDAGLLGSGAGTATWLLLGVALTLVLGGTAGLVAVRRTGT